MYKLTYLYQGKEHSSIHNDLLDAQEEARNLEIHLGVPRKDIRISIEY